MAVQEITKSWAELCATTLPDTTSAETWVMHVQAGFADWLKYYAHDTATRTVSDPAFVLVLVMCACFAVVMQILRARTVDETKRTKEQLLETSRAAREDRREDEHELELLRQRLAHAKDIGESYAVGLAKLKSKCAKKIAYVRHVKAVNANFTQEYQALRTAFAESVPPADEQELDEMFQRAEDGETADVIPRSFSHARSSVSAARREGSVGSHAAAVRAAHESMSPARSTLSEASPARTVDGRMPSVASSPSPDYAQVKRMEGTHGASLEGESAIRARLTAAREAALAATQERDATLMELHEKEQQKEQLLANLRAMYAAQAEYVQNASAQVRQIRSTLVNADRAAHKVRRDGAPGTMTDAEFRRLQGDDEASQPITWAEVEALPFNPFNAAEVAEVQAETDDLEAHNAYLMEAVEAGWAEMEKLMAFAAEQEDTVRALSFLLQEDQATRDADAAVAVANGDVFSAVVNRDTLSPARRVKMAEAAMALAEEEAMSPNGDREAVAAFEEEADGLLEGAAYAAESDEELDGSVDDDADLPHVKGVSLAEESEYLAAYVDTATDELDNALEELDGARGVLQRLREERKFRAYQRLMAAEQELLDGEAEGERREGSQPGFTANDELAAAAAAEETELPHATEVEKCTPGPGSPCFAELETEGLTKGDVQALIHDQIERSADKASAADEEEDEDAEDDVEAEEADGVSPTGVRPLAASRGLAARANIVTVQGKAHALPATPPPASIAVDKEN